MQMLEIFSVLVKKNLSNSAVKNFLETSVSKLLKQTVQDGQSWYVITKYEPCGLSLNMYLAKIVANGVAESEVT
jgi:hypothetical protein